MQIFVQLYNCGFAASSGRKRSEWLKSADFGQTESIRSIWSNHPECQAKTHDGIF